MHEPWVPCFAISARRARFAGIRSPTAQGANRAVAATFRAHARQQPQQQHGQPTHWSCRSSPACLSSRPPAGRADARPPPRKHDARPLSLVACRARRRSPVRSRVSAPTRTGNGPRCRNHARVNAEGVSESFGLVARGWSRRRLQAAASSAEGRQFDPGKAYDRRRNVEGCFCEQGDEHAKPLGKVACTCSDQPGRLICHSRNMRPRTAAGARAT